MNPVFLFLLVILASLQVDGYWFSKYRRLSSLLRLRSSPEALEEQAQLEASNSSPPSGTGLGASLVNLVMNSPLYYPIVNNARQTMVKTAEEAGIAWSKTADSMQKRLEEYDFETKLISIMNEEHAPEGEWPDYYTSKFHGYKEGNLCTEAAIEQEIAGKAVGARNFPAEGIRGEEALRGSYDREIATLLGDQIFARDMDTIVDFGCGTGTSTRRLAKLFPWAKKVVGLDFSPYMIGVGRFLLEPNNGLEQGEWVEDIQKEDRVVLKCVPSLTPYPGLI